MLETIRQYARERVIDADEAHLTNDRHLDHFESWMAEVTSSVRARTRPYAEAIELHELEFDNIRAAVEWAITARRSLAGLRLVNALWSLWFRMRTAARMHEARRWLDDLLKEAIDIDDETRCASLVSLAYSTESVYDFEVGERAGRDAVALALELGNEPLAAQAYLWLGLALLNQGLPEAADRLRDAVTYGRRASDPLTVVIALRELGFQHFFRAEIAESREVLEEATAEATRVGLGPLVASVDNVLGAVMCAAGELEPGLRMLEDASAVFASAKDLYLLPIALAMRGVFISIKGDLPGARQLFERATDIAEEAGFGVQRIFCAINKARFDAIVGDVASAGSHLQQADALLEQLTGRFNGLMSADVALVRATIEFAAGDAVGALRTATASLPSYTDWGIMSLPNQRLFAAVAARACSETAQAERYVSHVLTYISGGMVLFAPEALEMCAVLKSDIGADADAVRLIAAAKAARTRFGTVPQPDLPIGVDEELTSLRSKLDATAFDDAWSAGEQMGVEDAIAFALRGRGPRQRPQSGWDSLTPTESQVVALAAGGLSNAQVGEKLFMSARTVSTHLTHIYAKVGVSNRAELAGEARKRGI
jgi:DNA-binding CsgD family transcriptional regulator/tetratricopeptide (TPR) repeat protein